MNQTTTTINASKLPHVLRIGFKARLVGLALGLTLAATAGAQTNYPQRQGYTSPPSQSRSESSGLNLGGLIAGALIGAAILSALGGSSDEATSSNNYEYRYEDRPSSGSRYRPDTSVGCAWGDRAYGTCH